MNIRKLLISLLTFIILYHQAYSQKKINLDTFIDEQIDFIDKELQIHMRDLKSPGTPSDSILGVSIKGDFALSHLALLIEINSQLNYKKEFNYDPHFWIEELLRNEAEASTFAQLFAMETRYLQINGPKPKNQRLSKTSEMIFSSMSNIRKFYNPETEVIINNRPPNYLAVALLTGALAYVNGYEQDKEMLMRLLQKCIAHLHSSGLYLSDDNNFENTRYDRYGMEYSIFLYNAAKLLQAKSELEEIKPFVKYAGQLWWNLLHPQSGYSFQYGRSLQNTWDDTMEQSAFFLQNPEVAPAKPDQLASAVIQVWNHYKEFQFNSSTHLNRMLEEGRGTYSYAGKNRIWGYTIGTFSKALQCFSTLKNESSSSRLQSVYSKPKFKKETKYLPFRIIGKPAGLWIVKTHDSRLMLPFTDGIGNKPNTDYLPAIYGIDHFSCPVSSNQGYLVPEITFKDSSKYIVSGRPDSLFISENQTELKAFWYQIVRLDGKRTMPIKVTGHWKKGKDKIQTSFNLSDSLHKIESIQMKVWTTGLDLNKWNKHLSKNKKLKFNAPVLHEKPEVNEKGAFAPLLDKLISIIKPQSNKQTLSLGYEILL